MESIKTTIDIPEQALADAIRYTGATTKREAVVKALEEFNRRRRVEELVASFGTWEIASNDEIEAGDLEEIGDVLFHACAVRHGVELLEQDRHFTMIREVTR